MVLSKKKTACQLGPNKMLVDVLEHFLFSHILRIIIKIDKCFSEGWPNHQPAVTWPLDQALFAAREDAGDDDLGQLGDLPGEVRVFNLLHSMYNICIYIYICIYI